MDDPRPSVLTMSQSTQFCFRSTFSVYRISTQGSRQQKNMGCVVKEKFLKKKGLLSKETSIRFSLQNVSVGEWALVATNVIW